MSHINAGPTFVVWIQYVYMFKMQSKFDQNHLTRELSFVLFSVDQFP